MYTQNDIANAFLPVLYSHTLHFTPLTSMESLKTLF